MQKQTWRDVLFLKSLDKLVVSWKRDTFVISLPDNVGHRFDGFQVKVALRSVLEFNILEENLKFVISGSEN